jgi:hypothetical protein
MNPAMQQEILFRELLQEQLKALQQQLDEYKTNTIKLKGFQHLPMNQFGTTRKQAILTMIHQAEIPFYWIIDIKCEENDPDIYLYCINFHVKVIVHSKLKTFLNKLENVTIL